MRAQNWGWATSILKEGTELGMGDKYLEGGHRTGDGWQVSRRWAQNWGWVASIVNEGTELGMGGKYRE